MRHLMAIAATIVFIAMAKNTTAETTGALDQKLLSKLRSGYQMNEADRARFNAISNTSIDQLSLCLLYTSPSPRDATLSRMPSSA